MNFKLIGGVLLVVGTSIGAGILGLPIAAAQVGFFGASILLLLIWALMLIGAFLILEVTLMLPPNTNMISMAKHTIGIPGQVIAWSVYLLLLYSLLCAYIAGGSGLLNHLLESAGVHIGEKPSAFLFTLLFGSVVYAGIQAVDKTNRFLISLKFFTLFVVIILLLPMVEIENLLAGYIGQITSVTAITVTITSFGWAILIPSLRTYFDDDHRTLKKVIIIASVIPLICYLAWDLAIMGVLPLTGDNSLQTILSSDNSTGSLVSVLSQKANQPTTILFINGFTSVSVLTSFLGVALCLTDFLADGFNINKKGTPNIGLHVATFLPALMISIFIPGLFITALQYAGIYCIVLLMLLPAWMAWCGRNNSKLIKRYTFPGGKPMLVSILLISICLILYTTLAGFF